MHFVIFAMVTLKKNNNSREHSTKAKASSTNSYTALELTLLHSRLLLGREDVLGNGVYDRLLHVFVQLMMVVYEKMLSQLQDDHFCLTCSNYHLAKGYITLHEL